MSSPRPLPPGDAATGAADGVRGDGSVAADGSTLAGLVAEGLDRLEREGPAALDALCAAHPREAPRLRAAMARLGAFGLAEAPAGAEIPERVGPFRILARLGGGGMGVVYAAQQEGLERRVALKLLRPGAQFFGGARERFRREVEVLARLQHPGIVPVHAGGEEQGVPYLAMELVRGATLEEALAGLPEDRGGRVTAAGRRHGRELLAAVEAVVGRREGLSPPPAGARGTPIPSARELPPLYAGNWVVTCTRLARALADALRHAHEQGVLHRDVKPSNVMLTPGGRVLLLDFGLAAAEGSARLTGTGQPLGSPAYMSPEQVRGDGVIDARADVWGLGVTLYEALTLHQPFATESLEATARLVLAAHPAAPRERNPAVPRDLETVVLAALEREPARRYASAAALLADLENVLELRPVAVRPPGPGRRLQRWAQRRPALAVACVLGALLLVAGPLGWELQRQRSLRAVIDARDQSERDFGAALTAIGYVLREVATDELEDVPRAQAARLLAIDRALALFPRLEQGRADEALVLGERAALHASRGDVLRDLGRAAEALPEFEAAIAIRRRLLARDEVRGDERAAAADRRHLALALDRRAKACFGLGRPADALPGYREAIELLRRAGTADEDVDSRLALVLANASETLRALGLLEEARAALGEARALLEAALERSPGAGELLSRLGRVCGDLMAVDILAGDDASGLAWGRRAFATFEQARAAEPGRRYHVHDVASAHRDLSACLARLGRPADAEAEARAGLVLVDGLLRDYPDVPRYAGLRALLMDALAVAQARSGSSQEVVERLAEVVAEAEAMRAAEPGRHDIAVFCAQSLNNLIAARIDGRADLAATLELLERGEAHLAFARQAPSPHPLTAEMGVMLAYNRGRALCFANEVGAAPAALAAFEARAGEHGTWLRYAADLWNELVLAQRRARALHGTAAPVEASEVAEAQATDRLFELLRRALDAGYSDASELDRTPALDGFREDPRYAALRARLPPPE